MASNKEDGSGEKTVNQLLWVYLLVSASLSLAWGLGVWGCSFLWVFIVIAALFVVWKTKLTNIVKRHLSMEEQRIHRKKALRQSETLEWLNFVFNRWWVFSSSNLEQLIKKRIDERLQTVKPGCLDKMELLSFQFGDQTPAVKYVRAFEYSEGVPGGHKPVSWVSVHSPPCGLEKMSNYQVVLQAEVDTVCEDFKMVFRSTIGKARMGLSFDMSVENLFIKGNLQVILHMSMDVPFPHVTKATILFTELPEVSFSVNVLKHLNIMQVPLIKSWLQANVMEGLTKALVDPGVIDIPIAKTGPIQIMKKSDKPDPMAQGVLTILIKGIPKPTPKKAPTGPEEVRYTMVKVGAKKRQTYDVMATEEWEDICSMLVYSLTKDKIVVKNKCRRLLTNITLDYHEILLNSLPLEMEKNISTTLTNKDGSKHELKLQYTPLTYIDLDITSSDPPQLDSPELAGVMFVSVHSAAGVVAADKSGTSDPYCVVFCDRRRVMTTPYIPRTRNPHWEKSVEFFTGDYTKMNLSFYVFDWDGSSTIDDDFLGSAHLSLKEGESGFLKKGITLGYNKRSEGYVTDSAFGEITVSVVFRPISSVAKSERYRLVSSGAPQDYLYTEDLVSPSSVGGGPGDPQRSASCLQDFPDDKILVDLTILQAENLMAMDRNGSSDPYCEVLLGNKKIFRTTVKKKILFPKWNESTTFEVEDDTQNVEINVYDKDVFTRDFLGKVMLTMDKLKEISYKAKPEWLTLGRAKNGRLQIKCTVTCKETIEAQKKSKKGENSKKLSVPTTPPIEDEVFEEMDSPTMSKSSPPANRSEPPPNGNAMEAVSEQVAPRKVEKLQAARPSQSSQNSTNATLPRAGRKDQGTVSRQNSGNGGLYRSASDLNMGKRRTSQGHTLTPGSGMRHSDSTNSFTALHHGDNISMNSSVAGVERIYTVSGRILRVRGLSLPDTASIYCKVRIFNPSQRLRLLSGNRVIAKSAMVKVTDPLLNTTFEIDRGAGVNVDTVLTLDIKLDHKEHVAQQSFTLEHLFRDYEEGGVQKWLPLSKGVSVEVFLTKGKPNPHLVNRKAARFNKSWSFRKEKIH
ncbi:extended synaptotagmin-1-like isoform X2 [Mizuhopecten yessoensis]|uniref:extended synaptotagmin-1-like isoform X2 n=1 Tax=Mizuhopecten yessoensis TaxID=6573 RepID=UPI000B457506|nr:extended synaptotagmin-1-like isoform X2 [Mizuhopecten yessoensis]